MLDPATVETASARGRAYKLFDGGGLFLHVAPSGAKRWRIKYRFGGRERLFTLGAFPAVSLDEARGALATLKAALAEGRDPAARTESYANFEHLARAWHAHNLSSWSPAHAADVLASLEADVLPAIGARPPAAVTAPELLAALRTLEARGHIETARRVRQRLSAIFGFGIALGICQTDPAAQLGRAMGKARPPRPMPALTQVEDCRALLAACETVPAPAAVKLAGRFLALTGVRLAALRGMRWGEVLRDGEPSLDWLGRGSPPQDDRSGWVWRVPAERMKLARAKKADARFDHVVPLSPAAVEVLHETASLLHPGRANLQSHDAILHGLVFPGRSPATPIGENALRDLYARTEFIGRHVPHGWRASFSTILNEDLGREWRTDIDQALGHAGMGKVEGAYNRSTLLARRRELYERWGALLAG